MSEKPKGLELLRQPFSKNQISLLPKPTKKENPKGKCAECGGYHGLPAVHLEYVGHAALTDRLLDADPNWVWEPMTLVDGLPGFDKSGGLWIKLTVCGVTRLGYGHAESSTFKEVGSREKEVIGDALRNAAMRFGAALDLWHKGDLHVDEDKTKAEPQKPLSEAPKPPQDNQKPASLITDSQRKRLFAIANKHGWNEAMIKEQIQDLYGIDSTKKLNRFNYDDLISKIEFSKK
jgi:hypothetical protein